MVLRIGLDSSRAACGFGLDGEIIERLTARLRARVAGGTRRRGPYVCISARKREETRALYEKVRAAQIHVSLRDNALRIAPYIYNTPRRSRV